MKEKQGIQSIDYITLTIYEILPQTVLKQILQNIQVHATIKLKD